MGTRDDLLHIYLRDHHALSTGERALARRLAGSHHDGPAAHDLAELADDVAADHAELESIMGAVGARRSTVKPLIAVLGERAGRLKLNGRLLRRSPLATVVELEMMRMVVQGKTSAWRTLRGLAHTDSRLDGARLDRLVDRAEQQAALLDRLHRGAAGEALAG